MPISGFWHAAAALSGRIDLSLALKASQELSTMSDRALSRCGISQRHITRLRRAPPLHTHPTALTLDDTAYPDALRDLPFAPPVLFYAGNLEHLRDPCVAIVGARRCTQRARDIAENFARSLAAEQVSIVSGWPTASMRRRTWPPPNGPLPCSDKGSGDTSLGGRLA